MTDFDRMSPEEIRAWAEEQRRSAAARFPGPVPPLSRVKMEVNAQPPPSSINFHLEPGARAVLNRFGTMSESQVLGLRRVSDDGPLALLVRENGVGLLALRRRYGASWGDDVDARRLEMNVISPPVEGWAITEDNDVVPAPSGATEELRVRTNNPIGPF